MSSHCEALSSINRYTPIKDIYRYMEAVTLWSLEMEVEMLDDSPPKTLSNAYHLPLVEILSGSVIDETSVCLLVCSTYLQKIYLCTFTKLLIGHTN